MKIVGNELIVNEILKDASISINYEIELEYKGNVFKVKLDIVEETLLEDIAIKRAFEDYGEIMEELYELDKAES